MRAKEYATGVKSAKEVREAGREAKPIQAGKPFKQVAQELEAALKSNIHVVQVEAYGEVYGAIACAGLLNRLSKSLARMEPPPATDEQSLLKYIPVAAGFGEPMYIPELTEKSACYGPRGNQVACDAGVCWSVRENVKRGRLMWPPPDPETAQREVPGAQGLPQRPKAAAQQRRPRQRPPEATPMYEDDEEDDDIRSKSSSVELAEVPDWQLVKRRTTERYHADVGEDEEEMELEEPADEAEDAIAELPTRLKRSDRRPDQVEGVLIDRLVRAHANDTMVVALIETRVR